MASYLTQNFVPVKAHIREQPAVFQRFGAHWTPTLLILDPDGAERHRVSGFLPADDLLAQLELGLAYSAFQRGEFRDAERRFRALLGQYPKTDAAPEALYWAGVAKYKASGDPAALGETAKQFALKYPESSWAKKASVWAR